MFSSLLNYHQIIDNNYHLQKRSDRHFKLKDEHFDMQEQEGIDALLKLLEVELKKRVPTKRYGVVIDADNDCIANWQRVRHALLRSGYDKNKVPRKPDENGTIIEQEEFPKVGVWIMPNNANPGKIEDFVGSLRRPDDVLWPIAEEIVQRVMNVESRFVSEHESKARIHT